MSNVPSTPATPVPSASPATPAVKPANTGQQPTSPAVPQAKSAPQAEETWDVQENGKVVKKTRKEIVEAYQLRQLSDRKRSEADKQMQEYQKLWSTFQTDPVKFMGAAGVDFDKLASSYIAKKAEDAMLDPKEAELRKAKAEAETYKKWVEEQKALSQKTAAEAAVGRERERIHQEIIAAIEESKELGMPVDEELVIAIAQKMLLQDKAKKPLNAKEALPQAYQSTQKWLQGMASKMEGEALVKWLGQDVALKIRKYDLGQLKAKRSAAAPQPASMVKPVTEKKEVKAKQYKTWSDFKNSQLDSIK